MKLSIKISGLNLRNPLILASGILGSSGKSLARIARSGAGAVVTKSIGIRENPGYPGPRVVKLPVGWLNAMGLPSPPYKEFLKEVKEAKKGKVPVIASIYGSSPDEFSVIAKELSKEADGVELNLSCPHAKGYGADVGSDPELVGSIIREVKKATKLPLWAKLTMHSDLKEIGRMAEKAGADAIVAINTVRAMAIDLEAGRPALWNKVGGLSGPAIKPIALRCIWELYEEVRIPLIGCGGISGWEDAIEFMLAGASAVQIGSAIHQNERIFGDIERGMMRYLEGESKKIQEIIGSAHED
jgi:dihydroorotate dehydrogenase (NAD+) catalytic subunit